MFLGTGGSNAPTAWPPRYKRTWSSRAFPPWRTRACSLAAPSVATRSRAHPRSTGPSAPCAHKACSVTGRTTGLPAGPPARSPSPGWLSPAWRAPTWAECPPSAGTAAGSCSYSTMRPSDLRDGAKRWRERRRSTTCRRRVSILGGGGGGGVKAGGAPVIWA